MSEIAEKISELEEKVENLIKYTEGLKAEKKTWEKKREEIKGIIIELIEKIEQMRRDKGGDDNS